MKPVLIALLAVGVLLAIACGSSTCAFITRCTGTNVERCLHGTIELDEACASPNECTALASDFAGCAVPNRSCADGGFGQCLGNARLACRSDSRKAGVSWVIANPCASGQTCFFDGGQS